MHVRWTTRKRRHRLAVSATRAASTSDRDCVVLRYRKLTDTPFPFPWAQAINITLLVFVFAAPIAVVGFTQHIYVATVLTFMAVVTHVMLNEVARDIEDPFHYDPNELPLPQVRPAPRRPYIYGARCLMYVGSCKLRPPGGYTTVFRLRNVFRGPHTNFAALTFATVRTNNPAS